MAEKRMFSKSIIDTDLFMDMPTTSQLLYFHLGMRADDEGFVSSPRSIMRICAANNDDLKLLAAKGYIIPFDSGVIVITHWKINNYIRPDRFKETIHQDEKERLSIGKDDMYRLKGNEVLPFDNSTEDCLPSGNHLPTNCLPSGNHLPTNCLPSDNHLPTQISIDKDSIDKDSVDIGEVRSSPSPTPNKPILKKYGEYRHIRLSEEQYNKLIEEFGDQTTAEYIKRCDEYIQQTGKRYKDYNLTLRNWIKKDGVKVSAKADYNAPGFWE